jgi:hypothetical protein
MMGDVAAAEHYQPQAIHHLLGAKEARSMAAKRLAQLLLISLPPAAQRASNVLQRPLDAKVGCYSSECVGASLCRIDRQTLQ